MEDVINPIFNRVIRFRLMTVQLVSWHCHLWLKEGGSVTMTVIQIVGFVARYSVCGNLQQKMNF